MNRITTNITLHKCLFVHDLFSFRREVLANGPRLRQVGFGYFFGLICYFVCAETTTVVLLALILYKIKFSVPWFVHNLSFGRALSHFGHLWCACAETVIRLPSVKNLTSNLTFSCQISYMSRNFGNWTTISCSFSQFSAAHAQKRPEFYFR